MKRITFTMTMLACTVATAHLACAEQTCPPTIKVEQKASAPDADWNVTYSGYDVSLAGVTIFEGPPAYQGSLVPDDEQTTHDTIHQTWKLVKSDAGYWLECEYANTTAQISRRLPPTFSRCDVTLERNVRFSDGRHPVKSVSCK